MVHLCAFGEGERILDVDAEITNGALDRRVAQPIRGFSLKRFLKASAIVAPISIQPRRSKRSRLVTLVQAVTK
jgi:hypothetical protein